MENPEPIDLAALKRLTEMEPPTSANLTGEEFGYVGICAQAVAALPALIAVAEAVVVDTIDRGPKCLICDRYLDPEEAVFGQGEHRDDCPVAHIKIAEDG